MSLLSAVKDIKRFQDIITICTKHGFGHIIERLNLNDNFITRLLTQAEKPAEKLSFAKRLRLALIDLGPTFIKFGQIMSTRSDLIPQRVINELKRLQDEVPPDSRETIRTIIEETFKSRIDDLFTKFDEEPIASASIGQVHRAVLKNGTEVVLKVQRIGIATIIESDLVILHFLANLIEKNIPESKIYQPSGIVGEFEKAIKKELDFTIEAKNSEKFAKNFASIKGVSFPKIYKEFSGKEILTMEYVDGIKISESLKQGLDTYKISKLLINSVMKMIFEDGFFHADPHPGNLFVKSEDQLVFLDLGQTGRLNEEVREKILMLMLALVREDRLGVANSLYDMVIKEGRIDLSDYRNDINEILDEVLGKQLEEINFGIIMRELISGARKHKMRIPLNITLMIKSILTLENVVKELAPEIKIIDEMRPMVLKMMTKRWSTERLSQDGFRLASQMNSLLQELPYTLDVILSDLKNGNITVNVQNKTNERLVKKISSISSRVTSGLLVSALIIGFAILVASNKVQLHITPIFGLVGFTVAALIGAWLVYTIIKSD